MLKLALLAVLSISFAVNSKRTISHSGWCFPLMHWSIYLLWSYTLAAKFWTTSFNTAICMLPICSIGRTRNLKWYAPVFPIIDLGIQNAYALIWLHLQTYLFNWIETSSSIYFTLSASIMYRTLWYLSIPYMSDFPNTFFRQWYFRLYFLIFRICQIFHILRYFLFTEYMSSSANQFSYLVQAGSGPFSLL